MTTPINLNKARKARSKAAKTAHAAENRVKYGRTKADRTHDEAERAALKKKIDCHRLKPDDT